MELSPELPECPVCLQCYDSEYTIPRVLACGHTACETCLTNLPEKYAHTVRCPACTQLVKFPPNGPSFLPKNIELLRFVNPNPTNPQKPLKQIQNHPHLPNENLQFFPRFWSHEFYSAWKDWILPNDAVLVETENEEEIQGLFAGRVVGLVRVGCLVDVSDSVLKFGYFVRVLKFLSQMREEEREVLSVCFKKSRFCRVFGLWGDLESGFLYLVCERLKGRFLDNFDGFSKDGLFGFALMGMEMCEAVVNLHKEGLVSGCLGVSCFKFDGFGHVFVDLSEVLVMGRKVYKSVVEEADFNGRGIEDKEIGVLVSDLMKSGTFVSPEVLFEVLKKEGIEVECGDRFGYSVEYSSDVWSLACVLLRLLIGKQFDEVMVDYVCSVVAVTSEENGLEKASSLWEDKFGEEFVSFQRILCQCLNFDPGSRPLVTDVWKCIREMVIKPQFDIVVKVDDGAVSEESKGHCLVLGELCRMQKERLKTRVKDELQGAEDGGGEDLDSVGGVDKDLVEGLSEGNVKSKDMLGHLDCITGLAVGGGFLFSSSFDKSVHVWSLQDFSHVQTFKGHEHKVMAVVYVDDEEEPLCVSGDGGGGIFVWSIRIPLGQEPLKNWYEEKDWRYSGIHALTTAGNRYLYTGGGDKTIKAWSLQDGTLSCTMSGHKSVVSTLAVCNGVLYSGSWDGTIRLWTLSDHSLLTVLGEDAPGTVASILSLAADREMLVAAHENGSIKVWRDDVLMKSTQTHNGAIFAAGIEGKWIFTGGWDKTVNVQELTGDEFQVDAIPIGSIPCGSVITALLCCQGKLYVGYADRTVKVYYYGK